MADGAGLVYNKQDDSGAAAVLKGSADMSPLMDFYKERRLVGSKDRKPDQALSALTRSMGQAWDNDLPELQEMYNEFTTKLKDYEQTTNPQERRDKWHEIQNEQFALRTYINKSAKNRAAFEGLEKKFSSDERFRYNQGDLNEAESWRRTSLKDRTDFPNVKAATTQSAIQALAKLVKYEPDVIEDKFTSKEGPGHSSYRTIIDPAKLSESIRGAMPLLPQNMQDAMKVEMQGSYLVNNPGVAQLPLAEQKAKFDEHIVGQVNAALIGGYGKKTKNSVTLREYGQDATFNNGAGAANKNGIWDIKRVSEDGKYFISVQPNKSSGVALSPTDDIYIDGATFKNVFKQTTVGMNREKVEDSKQYGIKGKLLGFVFKEGEKPSMRIMPVDPVTNALMQGVVKEVPFTNDNQHIANKYGDDPYQFYYNKKSYADANWGKEKKPAPTTGTSKGAAPSATGKPQVKNYAPAGLPPTTKPIDQFTDKEKAEYKAKLTTKKQQLDFLNALRGRKQ